MYVDTSFGFPPLDSALNVKIGYQFPQSMKVVYWSATRIIGTRIWVGKVVSGNSHSLSSFRLEDLDGLPGEIRVITAEVTISSSLLVPEVASSLQVKVD